MHTKDNLNLKEINAHVSKMASEYGLKAFVALVEKYPSGTSTGGQQVEITVINSRDESLRKDATLRYFDKANSLSMFDDFIRNTAAPQLSGKQRIEAHRNDPA